MKTNPSPPPSVFCFVLLFSKVRGEGGGLFVVFCLFVLFCFLLLLFVCLFVFCLFFVCLFVLGVGG